MRKTTYRYGDYELTLVKLCERFGMSPFANYAMCQCDAVRSLCQFLGVNYAVVCARLTKVGMTLEKAIEAEECVVRICKRHYVSYDAVCARIQGGISHENAIKAEIEEGQNRLRIIREATRLMRQDSPMVRKDTTLGRTYTHTDSSGKTSERRLPNTPNTKPDNEAGREF